MSDQAFEDEKMPAEIDFSKGVRGLHHIPPGAKVFLPASIERSVQEYFSVKAEQKGVELSELLTDVLKRDIKINEALK
jgi:exoribonuclease II